MYEAMLERLGLSENEAKIYEMLLFRGESKASDMVPESGLGRANVYNLLTSLVAKGLVTMTAGKQQQYRAAEPTKLTQLLEAKRQDALRLEAEFKQELPKLTSTFQLTTGRPTIQVFEGLDGFEEALNDSLTASSEILTYFDPAEVTGEIAEINRRYVLKRRKAGLPKRIILPDTPETHAYMQGMGGEHTDIRIAKGFNTGFKTAVEMYDNKVVFLTMRPEKIISVMIDDVNIAQLERSQFEYIWKLIG
jgi:sugar-specific transcriptional regulator TrmB